MNHPYRIKKSERVNFMKKHIAKLLVLVFALTSIFSFSPNQAYAKETDQAHYPIVMVHGLFGWGNNEMRDIYYWGGSDSLREWLCDKGYTVYTPTIGPISSNWDRACELYAYLKGGTVDYGKAHAEKYGHARYGRTYPGIYEEFGEATASGDIRKINLVGHSMGGQTIRTLVQLLEKGSAAEKRVTPSDELSPLFTGGKSWVHSVTTIATPHDGSQVAHKKYQMEPLINQFYAAWAAKNGAAVDPSEANIDFQLDQWGLKRNKGESYASYYKRVMKSNLWKKTKDLSVWDLSPEGAGDLNTWVHAQSDVYYFSIGCLDTHESPITGYQVPNSNMSNALRRSSIFMGRYTNDRFGEVPIDRSWWKNDGIVSVISSSSPKVYSKDTETDYNGHPEKGVWNYIETIDNVDHFEIVQMKQNRTELLNKYLKLVKMLDGLPKDTE
jgi:triacylglycerol lipase